MYANRVDEIIKTGCVIEIVYPVLLLDNKVKNNTNVITFKNTLTVIKPKSLPVTLFIKLKLPSIINTSNREKNANHIGLRNIN